MSSAGECPGKVWEAPVPFRTAVGELRRLVPWRPAGPGAAGRVVVGQRRGEGAAPRPPRGTGAGREPEPLPLSSPPLRCRVVPPRPGGSERSWGGHGPSPGSATGAPLPLGRCGRVLPRRPALRGAELSRALRSTSRRVRRRRLRARPAERVTWRGAELAAGGNLPERLPPGDDRQPREGDTGEG